MKMHCKLKFQRQTIHIEYLIKLFSRSWSQGETPPGPSAPIEDGPGQGALERNFSKSEAHPCGSATGQWVAGSQLLHHTV